MPTLLAGDYVFYSNFERLYPRQAVRHGDMVAFRLPKDKSTIYSERVVGLPGDRVQMIDGLLQLNGTPVKRERVDDFVDAEIDNQKPVKRWRETLPNGVSYETLDLQDYGFLDNTPVYTVPVGHFFGMGDNRDNSTDSRVLSAVGYVPFDNLVGRAQLISISVGFGEPAWHVWSWPEPTIYGRKMTHGSLRYAAGPSVQPAAERTHPARPGQRTFEADQRPRRRRHPPIDKLVVGSVSV
jgi:signal peptidase I